MLKFWKNPEFIRHCRSELRRSRIIAVAAVVLVLCILAGLGCWAQRDSAMNMARRSAVEYGRPTPDELAHMEQRNPVEFWQNFFQALILGQTGLLTFWVLFACAQSVSGERERKTWDFQRTTRLTPGELLIGKLLGEPVLAYFIIFCALPVTVIAGLLGEMRFLDIVYAYTLLFSSALFAGLIGLWISNMFESRSRGIGLIAAFGLYGLVSLAGGLIRSPFPGVAAFSPFTGLSQLLDLRTDADIPTLFGWTIPWVAMSLLLYLSFGAWFILMLVRNLKKEDLRLLSRWQVVGCVGFLNFLIYALFHPRSMYGMDAAHFTAVVVAMNALFLLAMGLATLTPSERLKVWWRSWRANQVGIFSEDGLPWPWLAISALIAYGLLIWGLSAWKNSLGSDSRAFQSGAVQMLAVLVFITRDVLFLQWCTLTRMRAPLVKGVLYLGLYYITSGVISIVLSVQSEPAAWRFSNLTAPVGIFNPEINGFHFPATIFVGMSIQLAASMLLLMVINRRLARPATIPAVVTG